MEGVEVGRVVRVVETVSEGNVVQGDVSGEFWKGRGVGRYLGGCP